MILEPSYAATHEITHIDIQVTLHADGSARIIEKRRAYFSEGTENFIVIGHLGKSRIKDFIVKEEGRIYEYIDDWDLEASRAEKAYKNSLLKTKDGYELVWGIGEYGSHEYQIEYTVTNFIKGLEDGQILFWRFVNDQMNVPPQKVTVKIQADRDLSEETEKIWGFGFEGEVEFQEGKIVARSNQALTEENYVTILVRFPENSFSTSDLLDLSFEEIREKAFKGSDYGRESAGFQWPFNPLWIYPALFLLILFDKIKGLFRKGAKDPTKSFKRKYRKQYYSYFPYDGDWLDIYYLLYRMGATNFQRLLSAHILKWYGQGKLDLEVASVGRIRKKKFLRLRFIETKAEQEEQEGKLYHFMLRASDQNFQLDQESFAKWVSYNESSLKRWEDQVYKASERKMIEEGYLSRQRRGNLFFKSQEYALTEKGEELEENFYKYINYLHDYSLLNEHEAVNVKIWDQIMVWATLLGLTKVVRKQFQTLYPNYEQESLYSEQILDSTESFTRESTSQRSSGTSRSSGGGGSTSSGGGAGSYGGGSGGGTR